MSYESKTWYKKGSWNVHCDVCGFRFKSDEVRKRWDGLMVCDADFELDHPQKYLRVKEDKQSVPFVRKQSDDNFRFVCDIWTSSPMADFGVADCARVGNPTNINTLISVFYTRASAIAGKAIANYAIAGVS